MNSHYFECICWFLFYIRHLTEKKLGQRLFDLPWYVELFVKRNNFIPGTMEREKANALKKSKSIDRARYENSRYVSDDEDNIVFEDFARLRLNEPE